MSSRHRKRQSLVQGLDREVYQVVRRIIDERTQYSGSSAGVNTTIVYDEIRRSNSSLNRKPKKLLEDSIGRVLETIQIDAEESASEAMAEQGAPVNEERLPSNGLNRSIVGAWSSSTTTNLGTNNNRHPESEDPLSTRNTSEMEATSRKRPANGEPYPKRRKAATTTTIDHSPPTHVSLSDVAGADNVVEQFRDLLVLPMTDPQLFTASKIQPSRGILIHGPPGCGKTMIANAVAAELEVNFISISAPSVISGMSGESEKALRDHFDEAKKCAPCLIFIDEIDAITPRREGAQKEMEKRIVAQLSTCMDDLELAKTDGKPVIVLAATNRPDALDPALRRGGRFDKEINMSVPGEKAREQILRAMLQDNAMSHDMDFALLARRTPGFVGADLKDLVSTAGAAAMQRVIRLYTSNAQASEMEIDAERTSRAGDSPATVNFRRLIKYSRGRLHASNEAASNGVTDATDTQRPSFEFTMADFLTALPKIQPSALREGFATIPSTTFESIGALSSQIAEVQFSIIQPILRPDIYTDLGMTPPSGALLWGPPGCGKTLLAKAVANSSHANFISVKGPELLNKYVGESERAVRQVFTRARSSVPVIIFFDELDSLVPQRDGSLNEASQRVVTTFLTELDGVGQGREGIFIIAATNRPDMIDPAMLRPGRLDSLLYIGLPNKEGCVDILRTLCKRLKNFSWTEEMADLARSCEGYSGADFEMLIKRAGQAALERCAYTFTTDQGMQTPLVSRPDGVDLPQITLSVADFQVAKTKVRRSVGVDDMVRYDRLREEWATK